MRLPLQNASSISDGASALVVTSGDIAAERGLEPIAKVVACIQAIPSILLKFTIAPVGAIEKVLKQTGWTATEVDLWEINEAFAMVTMAAIDAFNLDQSKVNVNGGACSLGHLTWVHQVRVLL